MLEKGFIVQQVIIHRALRIHGKIHIYIHIFKHCMWKENEAYIMTFLIIQVISLSSITITTNYYLFLSLGETETGFNHLPKISQVINGVCHKSI